MYSFYFGCKFKLLHLIFIWFFCTLWYQHPRFISTRVLGSYWWFLNTSKFLQRRQEKHAKVHHKQWLRYWYRDVRHASYILSIIFSFLIHYQFLFRALWRFSGKGWRSPEPELKLLYNHRAGEMDFKRSPSAFLCHLLSQKMLFFS